MPQDGTVIKACRGRCLAALLLAGSVTSLHAQGTGGIAVSAVVLSKSNCKFSGTTTAALNFNTINPALPGPATATPASLVVRCAGSAPMATFAIATNDGAHSPATGVRRMRHLTDLTQYLPYSLAVSPTSATVPKNTDFTVAITGTVLAADYRDALVGSYSDTVAVTVSP